MTRSSHARGRRNERIAASRPMEVLVILTCSYEELTALRFGASSFLGDPPLEGRVVAPTSTRVAIESLLPRLAGDLSLSTLEEQGEVETAVSAIVEHLRVEMETRVLSTHPAAEQSVAAYFDFAHALSVLGRVRDIGHEMSVLIEVMTGAPPDEEAIRSFVFPD